MDDEGTLTGKWVPDGETGEWVFIPEEAPLATPDLPLSQYKTFPSNQISGSTPISDGSQPSPKPLCQKCITNLLFSIGN